HTASFIVEWGSTIRRDAYLLIEVARKFRDKTHEMLQAAAQKVPTLYQLASEQRLTQIINDANDANRTEPITPRSVRIDVFHDLFPEYKSIDRMTRPRKYPYQRKSTRNFKHSR